MNTAPECSSTVLGGLSPEAFMRRYWQRRPLLVRQAMAGFVPVLARAELFALAADEDVESRLVTRSSGWTLAHGPFARRALPPLREREWTLLVQGVDLHHDGAHALLSRFRFVPDARLDDLMISFATDGGGVGPHVDRYDVFLLQASGRRRWRYDRQRDLALDPHAPLKILKRFAPTEEHVLEPGDLLYLPPGWAHEGVALGGDCMTYSIGMRAPDRASLAGELVARLAESFADDTWYRDAGAPPPAHPAAIPRALETFAADAVRRLAARPAALRRALGEVLSEPKPHVWFRKSGARWRSGKVVLDRRTRMLYDATHAFINGEAVPLRGHDAALLRRLADERAVDLRAHGRLETRTGTLLREWLAAGWLSIEPRAPRRQTTR
jgi:50S ribosomal protein L16 3-hydroxylase